jgi:hypothetical protein
MPPVRDLSESHAYTLSDMADELGFVPRHMRGGDGGIWAFIRRWFKDLFRLDRTL